KRTLLRLLENHQAEIRGVAKRLKVEVTTWEDFLDLVARTRDAAKDSGNETLENLMQGIFDQIRASPDCGVPA
ncbi:MAG: hypothetical protein ACK4S8_15145, partial [Alishewanella aestuarii]